MFEINLVPDIKSQLLKQQRMRNLVIFISIVVAAAAAGVVAILGSVVTGQNIVMSSQDKEMKCRSVGSDDEKECASNYGTAILKIENIDVFLTIQDQMKKISYVNENKMLLSRVFGVLDVILPTGDDVVEVSELTIDLANTTLNFDAQGDSASKIDYRALEVFKNTVKLAYYDYGRYMRYDDEAGDYVEIPTNCIDEVMEGGGIYGIYHRGTPGCEASVLQQEAGEDVTGGVPVEEIRIRRDYKTTQEKEEYKNEQNRVDGGKYFFESQCMTFGEDGNFDEEATRTKCQLAEEGAMIRDSSNGKDSAGNLVLRFSSTVTVGRDVFLFSNKHMRVIGPSRQNVTDSYTQIRDMFTERATNCNPEDADYAQCMEEVPNGS